MRPVDEIEAEAGRDPRRDRGPLDAGDEEDSEEKVKDANAEQEGPGGRVRLLGFQREARCEVARVHQRPTFGLSSQARSGTGTMKLKKPKAVVVMRRSIGILAALWNIRGAPRIEE